MRFSSSARAPLSVLLATTALTPLFGASPVAAQSLPTGASVAYGSVGFQRSSGTLNINQSSQTAIVNYQSFSIGRNNTVNINQPNSQSAILNRVTGNTPSTIAGHLTANGQVYLVNPNGIAITKTGVVKVGGGFVASSLGLSDGDFIAGRRSFRGNGSSARVSNAGTITIGRGGYAALIGGEVKNSGTIAVPMGKVGLGSGEMATLDVSGDGFLQVAMPTSRGSKGALISNSGLIAAEGGTVVLDAATARAAARSAVNISGTIDAHSISGHSGSIMIGGGDGGTVKISGTLNVASRHATGGAVTTTGRAIKLKGATIDASGATGGGSVKIGGDRHGGGTLAHAGTVTIDAKSVIKADATGKGNGGSVVVWSDLSTSFAGTISAKGGPQGGDGGSAEVSSKGVLAYTGTTDLTAAQGAMGTLLLDPENVTISTAADANQSGFTATGDNSVINSTTLLTALSTANVTVSTGTTGTQAGTITLAANTPLAWTTGATLTLQAAGAVTLNSAINAAAGGLTIAAGTGANSTATADISVARFTLASGNWVQNIATLPGFSAGDFQVASGASFLRAAGGAGTAQSPYQLTDIYGVQGIGTSATYLSASYQLANDVNAAGTLAWNGGLGFSPVGTSAARFTGSLAGAGHTITGLTIARPNQNYVGLIGYLGSTGTVSGLGLVGGSVAGRNFVGGLVGINIGTVSQSYPTGSVAGSTDVGGLVGQNQGLVTQSYASGSVAGTSNLGGLVGNNANLGTVSQSYASGNVAGGSGFSAVGGLVGFNLGTISQAYASGAVSGTGNVGGLVGFNNGTLTATYWDIGTTGQTSGVGNSSSLSATGLGTADARGGLGNYGGFDTSVWYQAGDLRPILRSEAVQAGGVYQVSNLHQLQLMGADLAGSYVLTRDIDASATNSTAASAGIFGAGGFAPITSFTGTLNGAGHTIGNLTINATGMNSVGLIGTLGSGGSVTDLGLVGGSVSGGGASVGGLVGFNQGSISRAYSTGAVNGSALYSGGLVGNNFGMISQAYSTGAVTSSSTRTGTSVGGLVGLNQGSISQAYSTGATTGSSNFAATDVGGLVGSNGGSISQAYSTGAVAGANAGGLVGLNAGSISQAYSTGAVSHVSGSGYVGGLVGDSNSNSTLTATYWDKDTSGQGTNGVGNDPSATGVTGLTTAQARTSTAYTNFDFTNVWYQAGDLRPILRSEAATPVNGVIPVSNLHQLQLMGADLAGAYRLTGSLDASATASTAASPGVFGAGGFVPVGSSLSTPFSGSLSGAGYTIAGLTIARPTQTDVGLIGDLGVTGAVSGLGLVGGSVSGASVVGGLVGQNAGGTVSQAYATGAVSGINVVGGLVGYNNTGTISQAYATGAVSGDVTGIVGGLVGYNNGGSTISQAYATGAVTGSGAYVGGLVGYNVGGLTSAYYDTNTTGQARAVGLNVGTQANVAGRTTAQMQDLTAFQTNYAGFDFANVWSPPNQIGQNNGSQTAYYPQLYALSNVVAVTPTTTRTYGAANPALIASYNGVHAGDFVTTLGTYTTAATPMSDVGTYAVAASGSAVTSTAGNAYRFVYVPGTLTITPATITVAGATGVNKTYDGTTALPSGATGFTYSGVLNGDAVGVSAAAAAYASANAGAQTINVSGLAPTGAKAGDYMVSATSVTGSGTISPRAVTLSGTQVYDGTTNAPAGTLTVTNLVTGDNAGLGGTGTMASRNVGANALLSTNGTLTGLTLSNGNYTLAGGAGTVQVTPAAIIVTAAANTKTYDGTTSAAATPTVTAGSIKAGDTATLAETYATANAGTGLTLTPTATIADGNNGANYTLTLAASGNGTINPAAAPVVPQPVVVPGTDATGLASTAERAFARDLVLSEAGLPFADPVAIDEAAGERTGVTASQILPGAGSADAPVTGSQLVARLSDPRFSDIVICLNGGVCLLVPEPARGAQAAIGRSQPQKTSQLESRPVR